MLTLLDAPAVPGLTFRCFRGEEDYPAMVAVIAGSKVADQLERTDSVDDIARNYRHLTNSDPYQDMLFAEVNGQVIGYSRVWWQQALDGARFYEHFAMLLPEWRGKGIRHAMLRHNESRLREIAAAHQTTDASTGVQAQCYFRSQGADTERDWEALLVSEGYEPVRHEFNMVRPNLEDIPDLPLPAGLEVRPVQPEHQWTIWQASAEAFQDEWAAVETRDEWFEAFQESPTFQPELWQVAWDGDQVAGMVHNFINEQENSEYDRKRGYTEGICVRRPWRRRGLARALIARSFQVLKDRGMIEVALGVDTENPNGALRLYESLGFRPVKRHTIFRKPLD